MFVLLEQFLVQVYALESVVITLSYLVKIVKIMMGDLSQETDVVALVNLKLDSLAIFKLQITLYVFQIVEMDSELRENFVMMVVSLEIILDVLIIAKELNLDMFVQEEHL